MVVNQIPVVCQNCWNAMCNFYHFQRLVIVAHEQLSIALAGPQEIEEDKISEQNEFLAESSAINEEPLCNVNTLTKELPSVSRLETSTDNQESIVDVNLECTEIISNHSGGSVSIIDIDSDLDSSLEFADCEEAQVVCKESQLDPEDLQQSAEPNTSKSTQRKNNNCEIILQSPQELDEFLSKWKDQFECTFCSETFPSFSVLRLHSKRQHPEKKCRILCCEKFHVGAGPIARHAMLHSEQLTFKCELCRKVFTRSEYLTRHNRHVHEQVKANRILNSAIGLPKKKCRFCGKIFKRNDDLEDHEANHLRVRLYKCLICSEDFMYRGCIYKHFRTVHPEKWENRRNKNPGFVKMRLSELAKDVV